MKKHKYLLFPVMAMALLSCNENEVPFYSANSDGIYFNYENDVEFQKSVNFADYLTVDSAYLTIEISMKTLGYLADQDRHVTLKAEPVEEYELAELEIPDIIVPAGATEINAQIRVMRPQTLQKMYAAKLRIDGTSTETQIGEGVEEKAGYTIYVQESYAKPNGWENCMPYFGEWNVEKHRFLGRVTQDNTYYTQSDLTPYNIAAVDSVRRYHREHPDEPINPNLDIPFIDCTRFYFPQPDYPYSRPDYWTNIHNEYLGSYHSYTFSNLGYLNGLNTVNEYEFYTPTEENMKEVNRIAVNTMSSFYNSYFRTGMSPDSFRDQYFVPILNELLDSYELVPPTCWVDFVRPATQVVPLDTKDDGKDDGKGDGKPTDEIYMSDFYGEYSDAKYRFMIKTLLEVHGESSFFLWHMFPVVDFWNEGKLSWTSAGVDRVKECYNLFTQKLAENPGAYDFTFPENVNWPGTSTGKDEK